MHSFKLGGDGLEVYLRLTQKNLPVKERNQLFSSLTLCSRAFEGFVGTAMGGNLSKRANLELSLTICGKNKITSLNRKYRDRAKPTDVLSFPLHHNLKKGGGEGLQRLCLGDIYICRDIALMQAAKFRISYHEELAHLFVHGFLHLLGYDHEVSKRAACEMSKREDDLLNEIIGSKKWKNLSK